MEEKEERAGVKRAVKITPATASQSGRSAWEFQTKRKGRLSSIYLVMRAVNRCSCSHTSVFSSALGGSRQILNFILRLPGPFDSRDIDINSQYKTSKPQEVLAIASPQGEEALHNHGKPSA